MTETDSDAILLDKIGGKYGDGSDYGDLGNADEDALLADDGEFLSKPSHLYDESYEELDHEPEEPDVEDVLDLEAQDVELDEDLEEKTTVAQPVTSTTQSELDLSVLNQSEVENREREDRFKSERNDSSCKSGDIPDSLDKVQVVSSVASVRNDKRNSTQYRNRGRGGNHANRYAQNQTVLINPHFKGQVKINNNARLAWDARQRINQKNQHMHQVGRILPFSHNRDHNQNVAPIQPWISNNRGPGMSNIPQFQPPPPQLPVFQPPPLQPPQVSGWNQYPPNSFNEASQQLGMNNNQLVFMHPLTPNIYADQQIQSQFNHPPPQFSTPQYTPTPLFSNPMPNTGFGNNQFMPPPNQFGQPHMEPMYPQFPRMQQNQYLAGPVNPQYNHSANQFGTINNNSNRFVRPKSNFVHQQKHNKRKSENVDARKKKRNLTLTNLHEVQTVTTLDPAVKVKQEKIVPNEDPETREYRLKIEEQKRKREEIFKMKEERRLKAIQSDGSVVIKMEGLKNIAPVQKPSITQAQERNVQAVHSNQPLRSTVAPIRSKQSISRPQHVFNNNININTNNDESSYDKQHLASFLTNRKILTKDQSLIDTSLVVISNLSAGTTDVRLRKMCQGIGDIKKLQMSLKERQATIQFNSVASAHAFFKKYQRTMLDLSMIQVTLKPMS